MTTTRTRLPLVLWIASAVFIVYGTTIPFNFVHDRQLVAEHFARVTWNPFIAADTGHRVSIPDFVGNVLLFVPFGLFGVWGLQRPRSPLMRVAVVALLGLILTTSVEILQLFTIDRTTSVSDVCANASGALGGAVGAIVISTFAEGFLRTMSLAGVAEAATFFPFLVAAGVVLAGALEPFDVTLDVGSVIPKLRGFITNPMQMGVPIDEGMSFLQHALFTSALVIWLEEIRVRSARRIAVYVGIALAVGAEASQLFIASRMPGVWDALIGVAGALAGVPIGLAFSTSKKSARWWGAVYVATAIAAAMQQLSPFTLSPQSRAFQWMPFLNYYAFTTTETVSHSAELILAYFPLGFAFALASRRRRKRVSVVLVAALSIAGPVEYLQCFVGGRFPDVTDVALSLGGAWLGSWVATRGWRLFDEQMALISPRQASRNPLPAVR